MDHHCPWLGNCIGFYNKKPFILAVFFGWVNLVLGVLLCIPKVIHFKNNTLS